MDPDLSTALQVAREIQRTKFASASAVLLAGSVVRGEATASSDLDLVVVFGQVEQAKRQSFIYGDWPVEVFIHDTQTLEYFFEEVDRPIGVPSLSTMVDEGVEIPEATEFGLRIKKLAKEILDAGPPPWSQQERDNSRYVISDMIEDIRSPRNLDELTPVLANLYTAIAQHYFRSRTQWSAKGKNIPRRLAMLDPEFCRQFTEAFRAAFTTNNTSAVINLSLSVLQSDGGFLFDGYDRDAPANWRTPVS